ncbi:MAG: hypothetical protein AAGD35_11765 [Actinomycetota bacterium]
MLVPTRIRPMAAVALAAALVLAACGSSSSDDTADSSSDRATAPATTGSTTEPSQTDDEPPPTTIPEAPAVFEGERVVAIGSNVWPIVGDLLALGVTPIAIYSQLGNQEQPDYITRAYGEQLADVEISYINLAELSPEELLLLEPDRVVMPEFFQGLVAGNEVWNSVLADGDNAVFVPVRNWQGSLAVLAEAAGENADPAIAELQAAYDRRLAEIATSLDYDPGEVLFNTFQWNEDGTYLPTRRDAPIVQIADELGFMLHPSLVPDISPPLSQETVTDMDADLVFIQMRNVPFASLADDPLWSTTAVAASGNVFERFQYGQQAGWLETVELLDQLAEELPLYRGS